MARLSEQDIENIKKVYEKIGTYAGTARATGFSASTVKRYVTGEVAPKAKKKDPDLIDFSTLKPIDKNIEPLPIDQIKIPENFSGWTILSRSERDALNLGEFRRK